MCGPFYHQICLIITTVYPITILSHWHPLVLIFLVPDSILLSSHDCLLRNLYAGQEATVRTGHGTADWFQIGKGVCQGCILSSCLFNLYAEFIMQNAGLDPRAGPTRGPPRVAPAKEGGHSAAAESQMPVHLHVKHWPLHREAQGRAAS